jgi:hypothetical protein
MVNPIGPSAIQDHAYRASESQGTDGSNNPAGAAAVRGPDATEKNGVIGPKICET